MTTLTLTDIKEELARRDYLEFVKYVWAYHPKKLVVGKPTIIISNAINNCLERYERGESVVVVINVPPRHGKSDLVSRYLPPYFMSKYAQDSTIVVSHALSLTKEFSRFSRALVKSSRFKRVFPHITADKDTYNTENWTINHDGQQNFGLVRYFGITSKIAGAGANLMIIDDYHGKREDADSGLIRDKVYEEFTDGIIPRLSPERFILFILATRWHKDDLVGRILERKELKIDHYVKLPAIDESGGVLFPERFSREWYERNRRLSGRYGFHALFQQEPVLRGGNRFEVDNIKIVDESPLGSAFVRTWDLASSDASGDYTVGVKGCMAFVDNLPHLHIEDIRRVRYTAPKRNKLIIELAKEEGIRVGIEGFGAYKDAFEVIKEELRRYNIFPKNLRPPGDKEIKAQPLEAIIEDGRFTIKKAAWNKVFINEMREFPGSVNDDQVDGTSLVYHMLKRAPFRGENIQF